MTTRSYHRLLPSSHTASSSRFTIARSTTSVSSTVLFPHRFNGGYDASAPLTWTPQQAAEFVMFHPCEEPKYVGQQLRPAIQHWSGFDLAEFLTRLYLGDPRDDSDETGGSDSSVRGQGRSVVYEPQNVRSPKWNGLHTKEGISALTELLKEALSSETLDPREISRFAEEFFLKEYKWPVSQTHPDDGINNDQQVPIGMAMSPVVEFESDSFYSLGHSVTFAHVLWVARKSCLGVGMTWDDLVAMITLPEFDKKDVVPMQMIDFYKTISSLMHLTNKDRASLVNGMAIGGWEASNIPIFVSQILPLDFDDQSAMDAALDEWRFLHEDGVRPERASPLKETITFDRKPKSTSQMFQGTESEFDELVQEYWSRTEIPTR